MARGCDGHHRPRGRPQAVPTRVGPRRPPSTTSRYPSHQRATVGAGTASMPDTSQTRPDVLQASTTHNGANTMAPNTPRPTSDAANSASRPASAAMIEATTPDDMPAWTADVVHCDPLTPSSAITPSTV